MHLSLILFLFALLNSTDLSLSSDKVFKQIKNFYEIDINQDNMIDFIEMKLAYKNTLNINEIDSFFQNYDYNKDGVISLEEYFKTKNPL